jgi:hypothetical protein
MVDISIQKDKQKRRIDRIVAQVLYPTEHRIIHAYSDDLMSFQIENPADKSSLAANRRGTRIRTMENLSDEEIENWLRKSLRSADLASGK